MLWELHNYTLWQQRPLTLPSHQRTLRPLGVDRWSLATKLCLFDETGDWSPTLRDGTFHRVCHLHQLGLRLAVVRCPLSHGRFSLLPVLRLMLQFHLPLSAPELSTCAASFSMASFAEASNTCTSHHAGYVSKLSEGGRLWWHVDPCLHRRCSQVFLVFWVCDTESCWL